MLSQEEYEALHAAESPQFVPSSKFVPKLTHHQRCQALALLHFGFPQTVVAQLFGIHRQTVNHLWRPTSRFYTDVRLERETKGHDNFQREYVDPVLVKKAKDIQRVIQSAAPVVDKAKVLVSRAQMAAHKKGLHQYKNVEFEVAYFHQGEAAPIDERGRESDAGWWFRISGENEWLVGWHANAHPTSKLAFDAACDYLEGEQP